jgi:TnpA family transposase/DNA-binding MarR family transcriptional regulator
MPDGKLNDQLDVREAKDGLPQEIDENTLRKYFTLTEADLAQVELCRGAINRLGFAVQLCTLRWLGYFLREMQGVPEAVIETMARQLGLLPISLESYPQHENTEQEHQERVRRHLGFVRCELPHRQQLLDYITDLAQREPRIHVLRQNALDWLYQRRIVRPGITTLRDILTPAREAGMRSVYTRLAGALSDQQQNRIDVLLAVPTKATTSSDSDDAASSAPRSPLEDFKGLPGRESPDALSNLVERMLAIQSLDLANHPVLKNLHSATRRVLAGLGYRYTAWTLRRFGQSKAPSDTETGKAKRYAIVLCFLEAALAETIDAIVEMQDKLITRTHNRAKDEREALLRTTEQARGRAVAVLENLGSLVLDPAIPSDQLRERIFQYLPNEELTTLVEGCRKLRVGDDGSHLGFVVKQYPYTRRYSPKMLAHVPFEFRSAPALGEAVEYLRRINKEDRLCPVQDAPLSFVPKRWSKYVVGKDASATVIVSRPAYELALLTTLNERIKSGDVTLVGSRRWGDFEDYLIPVEQWERERTEHYRVLQLPISADEFVEQLQKRLATVTREVDDRVPQNQWLTIDGERQHFHLAALRGQPASESVSTLKRKIEARLRRIELADLLIDIDSETNFLRHFLHSSETRLSLPERRRNVLAALIATGCNIGSQRMAAASGISLWEIIQVADWHLTEDALKAASVEIVNFTARLPLSQVYGRTDSCSADGMRFYVPVNLLSADYSHVLGDHGVTMMAHTASNYSRIYQQPIPCRLRESAFVLDGLLEHDTELDPRVCYTDTHGYTEVVMATAALLGYELAPRIKGLRHQTLYKIDRGLTYPYLDPILSGTVKVHLIRDSWDAVVRLVASLKTRIVSPSLMLQRLGSYARQNSMHQALAEIGRVEKTIHILRTLDSEDYRRRMGRELNKGESSHDLSRFLCFGKEGALRGREFEDQLHTFSCLALLHNAVVAWNTLQIGSIVDQLRREGENVEEADLALTSPLLRRHLNPFGRYHFDLERLRRES